MPGDDRLPPPGSIITRKYKGGVLQVKVLDEGFEWAGEVYTSLSAVAKAVSGSHCKRDGARHLWLIDRKRALPTRRR